MQLSKVGVLRQLSQKPSWLAVFCACLLLAPAALPQKLQKPTVPDSSLKLETAQDTNDRIAQLAAAAAVKQEDYVIGSGDLLAIEVFDVPELSREVRVNESGFVSLPLVPVKIRAAGLTSFQFQDTISELLQANGLVNHPEVTVVVKERHGEPITVVGAVKTPMVIQTVGQTTLLEVLTQAGGVSEDAGALVVVTRRPHVDDPGVGVSDEQAQPTTITIDLNDLLDSGDPKYNIPLIGGDVVNVPHAGVVYAVGAVQRAGGFVLQSGREQMTVLKLLALTGGLTPTAKSNQAVILRRDQGTGLRQQVPVDVRKILTLKSEDVALRQSDILFVPDSAEKHALRRTGEIAISLATGAALYRVAY